MNRLLSAVLVGSAWAAVASSSSNANGPFVTYYQPVTAYYAPAASVVVAAPAPMAYTAASPVVVGASPAPVVVAAPVPTVAFYPPPSVVYAPATRVVTRFRPLLGGTVSRVRYGFAPVVVVP